MIIKNITTAALLWMVCLLLIRIFVYQHLAPNNRWVAKLPEGSCIFVIEGGEMTPKMKYKGYHLADNGQVTPGEKISEKSLFTRLFPGLIWLGPTRSIYSYQFEWGKWKNGKIQDKIEEVSQVLVTPYQYALEIRELETGDNNKVDITIVVMVQINNPWYAMFGGSGIWLSRIEALLQGSLRSFIVRFQNPDEVNNTTNLSELWWSFMKGNSNLWSEFQKIGVKVGGVEIVELDLGEFGEKIRNLNQEKVTTNINRGIEITKAETAAKVTRITSEAEAAAILNKAAANNKAIADLIQIIGPEAAAKIIMAQQLKSTDKVIIGGGNDSGILAILEAAKKK